jgi:hypothetical protein
MKHSSREDQRPADLWFWDDWFSSADVKLCSLAAQGLWINILGLMSRSEFKGALLINGKQIGSKELAILTGKTEREITPLIDELWAYGVYDKLPDGTIINRRMYRRSDISQKRADAGRIGGQSSKQNSSKDIENVESKTQASVEDEDEYSSLSSLKEEIVKRNKISSDDLRLVELLISMILKNDLKSHVIRNLTDERKGVWITASRLLREADGHTPAEIETVIRFAQSDSFWKTNILSMPKLREKWDQLWLKAKRSSGVEKYDGIKTWLENETAKEGKNGTDKQV